MGAINRGAWFSLFLYINKHQEAEMKFFKYAFLISAVLVLLLVACGTEIEKTFSGGAVQVAQEFQNHDMADCEETDFEGLS